jgi:formyl-CoA transferase
MREPGTRPTQGLAGMGDHPTGVALYAGIVTALLERERSGKGCLVHTSLLANGLWSVAGVAQGAMAGGDMAAYRETTRVYPPMFRPYRAADDRWLQLNMVRNEELLSRAFTAMEATHLLVDERFATLEDMLSNRAALGDELQAIIGRRTSDEWLAVFAAHEVPVNRIALVEETVDDRQIIENHMAMAPEDPGIRVSRLIRHPIQISTVPRAEPRRAPDLGEHSREVLAELGYSAEEIAALEESGVFQSSSEHAGGPQR